MNTNNDDKSPNDKPKAAEPSGKPGEVSPDARWKALLAKTVELLQSGDDPARRKEFLAELEFEWLQRIDEIFAKDREYAMERWLDANEASTEFLRLCKREISRNDLTFPESKFLHELIREAASGGLESLTAEKARLERKRGLGPRGRRRSP